MILLGAVQTDKERLSLCVHQLCLGKEKVTGGPLLFVQTKASSADPSFCYIFVTPLLDESLSSTLFLKGD